MSNTGISVGIVAVVGDYGVGKTCLLQRFVTGKYSEDHQCTIGLNYQSKVIDVCGRKVKLHFMDTGGDEKFESINMIHVRRSVCVLLVYDVTREKSIIRIDKWFKNIEQVWTRCVGNNVSYFCCLDSTKRCD
ncbi:uncharacterized protein LOC126847774 [Adelges cooleyi]|uniref:uncharacterized protein LOC126847774 n=1 Tax=Adelges cooleyi TaxID=133065 RepID=UPI0021806B5E|nr:uncharacterized protein LOC126847774 [Adelges cooleyi]